MLCVLYWMNRTKHLSRNSEDRLPTGGKQERQPERERERGREREGGRANEPQISCSCSARTISTMVADKVLIVYPGVYWSFLNLQLISPFHLQMWGNSRGYEHWNRRPERRTDWQKGSDALQHYHEQGQQAFDAAMQMGHYIRGNAPTPAPQAICWVLTTNFRTAKHVTHIMIYYEYG